METRKPTALRVLGGAGVFTLFLLLDAFQYQLFHLFAEGFSIAVSVTLFLLVINVRRMIGLGPIVFLGLVSGGVALTDFLHVIAFPTMGLFPGFGVNLAAQFWVVARGLEAIGFFVAVLWWDRDRPREFLVALGGLGAFLLGAYGLILAKAFPDMYVDGQGLTPLKVGIEYAVMALILGSLGILVRRRKTLNADSFRRLTIALIAAVLAEACFTLYTGPTDFFNVLGHFFKVLTYYFFYLVLIQQGLLAPYEGIFRQLQEANAGLEATVAQRTRDLRASVRRFRTILEASPWPLILLTTEDGVLVCTEANPAARELVGGPAEGKTVAALLEAAGLTGSRLERELGAVGPRSGVSTCEVDQGVGDTRRTFDATVYPVDDKSLVVAFSDVTARRRSLESYQLQDQIFQLSGDLIVVLDRSGTIRLVNPAWNRTLGLVPAELLGRRWEDLLAPDERGTAMRALERAWHQPLPASVEVRMHGAPDLVRTLSWNVHPSSDGQLLYGVGRDVTTERATEAKLREASKLESVAVIAGGIAHDFNNMLSGLFGFAELAKLYSSRGDLPKVEAALDRSLQVFDRAKGLTRQLLAVSKGGAGVPVVLDLGPLVRQAADFALAGTSCQVDWQLDPVLGPCEVDADQVFQACQNLLLNAQQAMNGQGTIHVRGRNDGPLLRLEFEDEGPGVPPALQSRIFEPFFTSKPKGTGLGLAVVASIAAKHGGRIELRSPPGHGAVFLLVLPVSQRPIEAPLASPAPPPTGALRVLVMDDDPDILAFLEPLLRSWGHDVSVATEGKGAVAEARRAIAESRPFRVALLDWTIRGGPGGADTLKELRGLDPGIRIVVTTGYAALLPVNRGYDALLAKPFRIEELKNRLFPGPAP